MSISIRPADIADLDEMVELLVADGEARQASDRTLWKMDAIAGDKVRSTVKAAMENERPPFRQQWLLAETDGRSVGVAHTILLPVPPIYAAELGAPGLLMEDCCLADDAPSGTAQALLDAAEADLVGAGARILLSSSAAGGMWEAEYGARDYEPLTLYLAKVGLRVPETFDGVRDATEDDLENIVRSSAENRRMLFDLDCFWKPHDDADARFGAWMRKSLTLTDRDMFVSETDSDFTGYVISHAVTSLHFPSPHDIGGVGVIDDFYHVDLADPATLRGGGAGAAALLHAAEAALKVRGKGAALIVCPAAWTSKIAVLEAAGYRRAITWFIKR